MIVNTGIERCKTLRLTKSVGGVTLDGYPKDYSILSAFTVSGVSFGVITEAAFQELTSSGYTLRLAAFKAYVSEAEGGVDIDSVTVVGFEAYRENLTACPIGEAN